MKTEQRPVFIWLLSVCALIVAMVGVGGITRLTGSGLSIVEWKPIVGAVPPLSSSDWMAEFAKYQQTPQFLAQNYGMTISEFKSIYLWEYVHRLLGRLIGVAFFIPFFIFVVTRRLRGALAFRAAVGLILGGTQGVLGWYMVKSGLILRPEVSHYRLAAHLGLALFVLGYLFWLALGFTGSAPSHSLPQGLPPGDLQSSLNSLRWISRLIVSLIFCQVLFGALVAGLHAGLVYNTYPLMNGQWFPLNGLSLSPVWINGFENPATVQWIHRSLGAAIVISVLSLCWALRGLALSKPLRVAVQCMGLAVVVQFLLGLLTLLYHVPIILASLHQLGATLLFLSALGVAYATDVQSAGGQTQTQVPCN